MDGMDGPPQPFPCTKCGACCLDVRGLGLPLGSDGRRCSNLTSGLTCAVYEDRPEICRVDRMRPPGMAWEEWHRINTEACGELQRAYGIDSEGNKLGLPLDTEPT